MEVVQIEDKAQATKETVLTSLANMMTYLNKEIALAKTLGLEVEIAINTKESQSLFVVTETLIKVDESTNGRKKL